MNKKLTPTFWITNMSKMNVSLADLNLTVKAHSSVNLLDQNHYKFTLEQVLNSAKTGSLYRKRDKISIRKVPPKPFLIDEPILANTVMPSRERSAIVIQNKYYEELELSDEEVASDNADLEIDKV